MSSGKKRKLENDPVSAAIKRSELMIGMWANSDRYYCGEEDKEIAEPFVELCKQGSQEQVANCLEAVTDLEKRKKIVGYHNNKALRMAAKHHNWPCVFLLLEKYDADIHAYDDKNDGLSLIPCKDAVITHACYAGDEKILRRLLSEFHPTKLCTDHDRRPTTMSEIDIGVKRGHIGIVQALLDHGETERYPFRNIGYLHDREETQIQMIKLLWHQWMKFQIKEQTAEEQKEAWTNLLEAVSSKSGNTFKYVWSLCPDAGKWIDKSKLLEQEIHSVSYRFPRFTAGSETQGKVLEFLRDQGAQLEIGMLQPMGEQNQTPLFKWLQEQWPDTSFAHLTFVRAAFSAKQHGLMNWIFSLPNGDKLKKRWESLKKKCSNYKCENIVEDAQNRGGQCGECEHRMYVQFAEIDRMFKGQAQHR